MLNSLKTEIETALALEESEYLLRQLTMLTQRGRITWRCTRYQPLEIMPAIQEGKPETAYLTHTVIAVGEYHGRSYLAEIDETLTIPESEGSVTVALTIMCSGERIASHVWDDSFKVAQAEFAAAVLTRLAGSEAINKGFQTARYNTDYTPDDIVAHPLTGLGRRFCRERRFLDYHRIVTDAAYREKLLSMSDDLAAK